MKTHNFTMVNLDTDSISFSKQDGSAFSEEETTLLLQELNSNFPDKIKWEHDGLYPKIIVLKIKNYILYDGKKITKKGSSLKSSKTEKALKQFMDEVIEALVFDRQKEILSIYNKYIKEVYNLKDITRWVAKVTITNSVLNPERTTEQKKLDALKGKQVQMGDKYYMYFTTDKSLSLQEDWNSLTPNHNPEKLAQRIWNTLNIFKNVLPMEQFPKYHLKNKKIKEKLQEILNV